MYQGTLIASPNKVKSRIITRTSAERYSIRNSRLILYMGVLITYEEYKEATALY